MEIEIDPDVWWKGNTIMAKTIPTVFFDPENILSKVQKLQKTNHSIGVRMPLIHAKYSRIP